MGQIQFTISLVMIVLFAFAIMGFAITVAVNNNSNVSLLQDDDLSALYYEANESILNFGDGGQAQYNSIIDSQIGTDSQSQQTPKAVAITPGNVVGMTKNILQVGYEKIFGSNNGFGMFFTAFAGLIVFIIGLLIYKTWIGRNPE